MVSLKVETYQNPCCIQTSVHFLTLLFLQEVNSSLQYRGLVHLAWMALALQHGA